MSISFLYDSFVAEIVCLKASLVKSVKLLFLKLSYIFKNPVINVTTILQFLIIFFVINHIKILKTDNGNTFACTFTILK